MAVDLHRRDRRPRLGQGEGEGTEAGADLDHRAVRARGPPAGRCAGRCWRRPRSSGPGPGWAAVRARRGHVLDLAPVERHATMVPSRGDRDLTSSGAPRSRPTDGLASWENVARTRSITRPGLCAWRSSTVHRTEAPVETSVTVTTVPKAR